MGLITQDCISHIIIVRYLNLIKKDDVFQFCRIAYHTAFTHKSFSTDKCAVADFGLFSDDGRSIDAGSRCNLCGFCDPDISLMVIILCRIQCFSQFDNEISDFRKDFPGICFPFKKLFCNGLI